jgi:hypothetical protein
MYNNQIKNLIYADEAANLTNYSNFSIIILEITVFSLQICMCILVFFQSYRHKKIIEFIKNVSEFDDLTEPYSTNFRNICIKNFFLIELILICASAPQFYGFLSFQKKIGLILNFLLYLIWVPSVGFSHFLQIFKLYLILYMKKMENEINNWNFSEEIVIKNLNKLKIIAKILKKFHKIIGIQLTAVSTECALMFTLAVNFIKFLKILF